MLETKNYSFRRAATIKVPDEFFNPLRTGMRDVDDSWSEIGGIVPSQVTFITGQPGSGKTTLTLAIGACLAAKIPVAFISLEMSDFQLAHQAKKIPGFGGVDVTGEFDQELTMEAIRALKPGLIILDSIQKAARKMKDPDGKQMPFDRAQFTIVDMFTKYAKETWTPVFLIGHCDKSGNYKGPSDLLHDVDSHLLVNYDKEMDMRTFTFGKNRFGGIVQESLFGITSSSVWVGSPYVATVFSDAVITPTRPVAPEVPHVGPDKDRVLTCVKNLSAKWDGTTARATIEEVISWLKANDEDFREGTYIKDPKRVKTAYRGKGVACAFPSNGEICFGRGAFTAMEVGKIGYRKEQKHIMARCTTKGDILVWTIVHEWCHMYKDMQKHNNEFFDFVAEKYDWMMGKLLAS